MDVRQELADPLATQLLNTVPLTRLAYCGQDGFPRVIPVGFWWTGDAVIVCTAPTSPKVRALAVRPEVALTFETDTAPERTLMMRGRASIEIVEGVPIEYLAASTKTMDRASREAFEAQVRSVYRQMARISITPEWARAYDFAGGRMPEFLVRLVQETAQADEDSRPAAGIR